MIEPEFTDSGPVELGGRAPSALALGAAAELLVAGHIALQGYQVYRPLADDRGVDLVVDVGRGRHVMVQVKAIRASSHYVFMRKSTFLLESWVMLALVVFESVGDQDPHLYLIPATEWADPRSPLVSRDYPGLKSAPEYGVNIRKQWKNELGAWSATPGHVDSLLQKAHPER